MQYICYTPSGTLRGTFYFPSVAMLRYIETLVDYYNMADHRQTLKEMLSLTRTNHAFVPITAPLFSMDFYAADLIDLGAFTVQCPICEDHYTASEISRDSWHANGHTRMLRGGRLYFCPMGHELLRVQDWIE